MRQSPGIGDASAQVRIGRIAIALERGPKPLQKLSRSLPAPAHLKFKDHNPARAAELPHKRSMVAPGLFGGLTRHRRLVGLDIARLDVTVEAQLIALTGGEPPTGALGGRCTC